MFLASINAFLQTCKEDVWSYVHIIFIITNMTLQSKLTNFFSCDSETGPEEGVDLLSDDNR